MKPLPAHGLAWWAGVVPVLATIAAYAVNGWIEPVALADAYRCLPWTDGCVTVSRAVRSGPGLPLFRALLLPTAVAAALAWWLTARWLMLARHAAPVRAAVVGVMGALGAVFLVLYVGWLGVDGPWPGWLRRYGVTVYFGLTALAQLLLLWALWPPRNHGAGLSGPLRWLGACVAVEWLGGVLSVGKRLLLADPALMDRVENLIEWWFALAVSAGFVAMGELLRRGGYRLSDRLRTGRPPTEAAGAQRQ